MAVVQTLTGTQTCVVGTEHTLATPAGGKTYVLALDLSALAAGDVLEVKLLDKVLSTSTAAAIDTPTVIGGPAAGSVFSSIPLPSAHGCAFTIRQTAGTGRAVPWSVRTLD